MSADGKLLEASEKSNPDLFWAIRGGGGNFGIATALEYQLHPVGKVLAGTLSFAPGRTAQMLEAFAKFVAQAPDEMNVVGMVLPSEVGARFQLMVCHCGEPTQGNKLLAPLRALTPAEDKIRVAPYLRGQRQHQSGRAGRAFPDQCVPAAARCRGHRHDRRRRRATRRRTRACSWCRSMARSRA